jgi:hypothetical protein
MDRPIVDGRDAVGGNVARSDATVDAIRRHGRLSPDAVAEYPTPKQGLGRRATPET